MALSDFPRDLVRDQRAWNRTYEALAGAGPAGQTPLRRRLIRLSSRLAGHPFWRADRPSATPAELRHQVRAQERREARRAEGGPAASRSEPPRPRRDSAPSARRAS